MAVPSLEQEAVQSLPGTGELPESAATLNVTVEQITVVDDFDVMSDVTATLTEPFRGRRVSVAELYALADDLEAHYQQAGYVLARVTIPPQEVVDGSDFRLQVIDGYLASVDVEGVPRRVRRVVQNRLQGLVDRPQLSRADIERALLLAGRAPGLSVRSTLVPGDEIGATVLVVEGEHARFGGSMSTDNRLSDALGPWQSTLQLQVNQLLGQAEQIYGYIAGHANPVTMVRGDDRRRVGGGGISWPIGHRGMSVNAEVTSSDTLMRSGNDFIPDTRSRFDRASLRVERPLWLTRASEIGVSAVFEMSTQVNDMPDFGFELYRDELRVVRIGVDVQRSLSSRSQLALSLVASQGLTAGARTLDDVLDSGIPFSRPGARPDFTKLELTTIWNHLFDNGAMIGATLRGQYAVQGPLPSAELFSLDGESALSALVSGGLASDSGWTLRNELSRGFVVWRNRASLSPYVYLSGGEPRNRFGNAADFSLASGVGLRAGSGPVSLSMEYGQSRMYPDNVANDEFFTTLRVVF